MPVSRRRDAGQGCSRDVDSLQSLLGSGDQPSIRDLEEWRPERLGFDGQQPSTSSATDRNQVHQSAHGVRVLNNSNNINQDDFMAQKQLNDRLLAAINKETVDIEELKKLLEDGADPNACCHDHYGDVYACHFRGLFDEDTLPVLKKIGILAYVSEDWTPLHAAAFRVLTEPVKMLIKAGADPTICDSRGRTALDVVGISYSCYIMNAADKANFTEVVNRIISAGGTHNTMKKGGLNRLPTPLHTAARFENEDVTNILLQYGASPQCWDEVGHTPATMCVNNPQEDVFKSLVEKGPNVQDYGGKTPLRAAVDAAWLPGVRIALRAGADLTIKAADGETSIHAAALKVKEWEPSKMWNEKVEPETVIFNEIVLAAKNKNVIDYPNDKGVTALFHAVRKGDYLSVKTFLDKGASITCTNPNNVSVFHVAASHGHRDILKILLDFDKNTTKLMINSLSTPAGKGYAPIHCAVSENHLPCIDILKARGADVCLRTASSCLHISKTPLHMAAANDNVEIANCILRPPTSSGSQTPLDQFDETGCLPLHTAIQNGSLNIIKFFLSLNVSLAAKTQSESPKTALDMIMEHIPNPTDWLEGVFDSHIWLDGSSKTDVKKNDKILMPKPDRNANMDVIMALLNSGNEHKQKRLLVHPLVEFYIYSNWQSVKRCYILNAAIYTFFFAFFVTFVISVFMSKDAHHNNIEWTKIIIGGCVLAFLFLIIIAQEFIMNVEGSRYFRKPETWIKLGSLGCAIILPLAIMALEWKNAEWPRHVATVALLLACIQILNLISQFPSWGYHVVMFKKVFVNIMKVLGTFAILIFCFAISFMIQFHSQIPFNGPWDAFCKALLFMIGEFDYNSLFSAENAEKLGSSFQVARVLLIAFAIVGTIVLVNLISVIVGDLQDLKNDSNIATLEKQARYVSSLHKVDNAIVRYLRRLPDKYYKLLFPSIDEQEMPNHLLDAFVSIGQKNKEMKTKYIEQEMKVFGIIGKENSHNKERNHDDETLMKEFEDFLKLID